MSAKQPGKAQHKMPQRPKQHRREDISKREFEAAIPHTWTYEPKSQREYGIDGVMEIFEGDDATGLTFNVQLKGVEKETANKALIKTSTRNYWKGLAAPTLVVVVDGSGTIHYGWSHQFDPWGRKDGAASYQWELPTVWDESSAAEIEQEVRASRAARQLQSHLPIYWSVSFGQSLQASWTGPFLAALERLVSGHKELTRKKDQRGWAAIEIPIEPDALLVRLHGTGGTTIHYNDRTVEEMPIESIAADAALAMAVEIEKGGMEQLVADLIEIGIPESATLRSDPDLLGFATTRVASAGRADAAVRLVEKIYLDDTVQFRHIVPIEIARDSGRLTESAIRRIVEAIAAHAPKVEDGPASEFYYNAGTMIRRFDTPRGLELHDLAAERNPAYTKRSYWWTERGQMLFAMGDALGAADAYGKADRMGDESAAPLLADSLAMLGRYEQAVAVWERMQSGTRFIWGLKAMALRWLIGELGITSQDRQIDAAEKLFQDGAPGLDVLELDALHVLGLWRAGAEHRDPDLPGFSVYYVATAAFAVSSPLFYFEALIAVQGEFSDPDERAQMVHYIIVTAVQECGDEFRQFLLEDDHVNDEARQPLLELVDSIKVLEADVFVVRGDGKEIPL